MAQQQKPPEREWHDAQIMIEHAGQKHRYIVEIKAVDRLTTLNHVNQQLLRFGKQALLVAPYLTTELANYCRTIDLQFIDTAGNAYLRGPGLFVHIRGERPRTLVPQTALPRGAGTPTALRVIFVLLCKPALLNAPYREIVAAADVALGAVGWVFFDLEHRGLVVGKRKDNRRFLDRAKVMREWTTNYPIKLRPKLILGKFRAANPDWWRTVKLEKYAAAWGGEMAADRMTGTRQPGAFTIYINGDHTKFIIENRLRADPDGDIELLGKFWHLEDHKTLDGDLVPPLLVYADLMATVDPRNHDTAKRIYEQFLTDVVR